MLIPKLFLEDLLSVDKLHYKEVHIINDLYDLIISEHPDVSRINKKFKELVADIEHHFEWEEKKMFEYNFPDAYKHQYIHECALQQLYEVEKKWDTNPQISLLKNYLEKQLLPWFKGHIMTLDKVACDFLCAAGSN